MSEYGERDERAQPEVRACRRLPLAAQRPQAQSGPASRPNWGRKTRTFVSTPVTRGGPRAGG